MKKLIKEYWGFFLILIVIDVFMITSLFIKLNYDITTPASITKVSNVITVNDNTSSNINTVSVYSYSRVNILDYLIAKINPYAEIEETYQYSVTDYNLVYSSGVIQKKVSIYNAIIAGYRQAGYNDIIDENSFKGYIIHTLYSYAPKELKIGDIIIEFNNQTLLGLTGKNEFSEQVKSILYEKDKEYPITILRNGEKMTFNISTKYSYLLENVRYASFGIATYEYVIPKNLDTIPEYSWSYGDSIGPSGGLMQSLYVYESLKGNILTKNLKIVGTGTVDAYGNAGAIGGIYQKVITANLSKADLFIIPVSSMDENVYKKEQNYIDAMRAYQQLGDTNMKIIVASSLEDIIDYLSILNK